MTVNYDGEKKTLTYRQLYEEEFADVLKIMGKEQFERLANPDGVEDVDEEKVERLQELTMSDAEDLSEEDREEMRRLATEVSGSGGDDDGDGNGSEDMSGVVDQMFDRMHPKVVAATHQAAKYGLVPSDDDVDEAMDMGIDAQEKRFGELLRTPEHAREKLQERIDYIIDHSTADEFFAYRVGLRILFENLGATGN